MPLPSVSSSVLPPPVSSAALVFSQSPAPLPSTPPFSTPSSVPLPSSLGSLLVAQGWCLSVLGSTSVVSSAPPGFPPLSAPSSSLFSVLLASAAASSLPPAAPLLAPPTASSSSSDPSLAGFVAPVWGSAPVVPVGPPLAPGPQPSLFCPFTVPEPPLISSVSASAPLGSVSFGSAAGPPGFVSTASGSKSGRAGFTLQPGPSSSLPPSSEGSAAPSAPPLSAFAYPPDDPFAPGFADPEASSSTVPDPEAPVPPPLSDSIRAEVRRMYQYLVDLFPQPAGSSQAPPPRALFGEFFAPPPAPHQPVYLAWFEGVRSALSEADSWVWLLMPSGLLVRQIPYGEMRSLGLKVGICRGSRFPCLVLCACGGLVATSSWSVPSLTRRGVLLGRDMLGWARALLLTDHWTALTRLCSGPGASEPVVSLR